eukprot:761389-Hanusia_phi.AAC.1
MASLAVILCLTMRKAMAWEKVRGRGERMCTFHHKRAQGDAAMAEDEPLALVLLLKTFSHDGYAAVNEAARK